MHKTQVALASIGRFAIGGFGARNGRNTTGKRYPHSSTRQNARYARLAAGGSAGGMEIIFTQPVKKPRAKKVAANV